MAERNTPRRDVGMEYTGSYLMAASTTIEAGKMVMLQAGDGLAVPAAKGANMIPVGRAEETVTSGATGETRVRARMGCYRWDDIATSGKRLTRALIGDAAYVEDAETVRNDSDSSGVAVGVLVDVDDDGPWVATGHLFT